MTEGRIARPDGLNCLQIEILHILRYRDVPHGTHKAVDEGQLISVEITGGHCLCNRSCSVRNRLILDVYGPASVQHDFPKTKEDGGYVRQDFVFILNGRFNSVNLKPLVARFVT